MPASDQHATFRAERSFKSLDGLRCLCIVAVIWHHAGSKGHGWPPLNLGFLGVDLFFVISGFLIVTLLLRETERQGTISLSKFYVRRTLRIFPLYYGVIVGLAIMYAFFRKDSQFGVRFVGELPYYLTYTANIAVVSFGIVWSLAAEEQFYLLWPPVEKYVRKHIATILIILIVINQLVNFHHVDSLVTTVVGNAEWMKLNMLQVTFTPILLGIGAAHLLHDKKGFR